jgi:hypothetical protein
MCVGLGETAPLPLALALLLPALPAPLRAARSLPGLRTLGRAAWRWSEGRTR